MSGLGQSSVSGPDRPDRGTAGLGVNGRSSSRPPWMSTLVASGTALQAPLRSPSGSDTTSLVWSDTACRMGLSGYWCRSVRTSVLWNSERDRPSLEYRNAQRRSPSEVATVIWLGYSCGRLFGWTVRGSVFMGAAIAISSTTVVAKTFEERKVAGRLRDLVFGVLIV